MSSEIKVIIAGTILLGGIFGTVAFNSYIEKQNSLKKHEDDLAHDIKKSELEATYPPEYWTAKAREAEAAARTEQARIESEERLKIDARDREDAEREARREYEKHAPAEYWEQKRIEQEEITKRERNRLQYETEKDISNQHNEAIKAGAKALERSLERQLRNSTYGTYLGI